MIALIDYDAGNTCSVINALHRLDADFVLTDDPDQIKGADKVIFPGVGHAGAAMEALRRKSLVSVISGLRQPVLGICVGMQLLSERSEEGDTICLGLIPSIVRRFDQSLVAKVPHMGWNQVALRRDDPLSVDIDDGSYFYFVHSYYMDLGPDTIMSCTYGAPFSAAVRKDNFWGIQFHAEKSGSSGALLLSNFLNDRLGI